MLPKPRRVARQAQQRRSTRLLDERVAVAHQKMEATQAAQVLVLVPGIR